jgi:hypothetical protein
VSKKRAAVLMLPPTYHGLDADPDTIGEMVLADADGIYGGSLKAPRLDPNRDAYVAPLWLRPLAKKYGRFWMFHSVPTTVALPDNRFAKSLKGFGSHETEDQFRALLDECASHGVPRPSGYADIFHERFRSPRVNYSVNAMLAPAFAGGWQEAIRTGLHKGPHYKYDLRSAYLWAGSLGLPDTRTYTRSLRIGRFNGLYRIRLKEINPLAPFPFNRSLECIASVEEIETYGLQVDKVLEGVVWKRTVSGDAILEAVMGVSFWKQAGRSYWGKWSQLARVQCVANGKKWYIPNLALNIPWAHLIVSRVKKRLWEASDGAVHVFVDSVITPKQIATGDRVGDWRLETTYENGVLIRGTGQYGDAKAKKLDRMAGVRKDSPRRNVNDNDSV